ncbi:TULIP family P47-like protein [Aliiruegeria sabulilitoris]|uniref:TULIP family P47-like protein n=1 Tax=Aliiruegeria sabulilitoris TaxID=1510458 RepID=UPI00082AA52F|nr:TULIP family P47-like protein [Aliiruegeria sabulilitoris]NDR56716.1 hypothetical protein [Pseudoruegeria sp. M32A2M]
MDFHGWDVVAACRLDRVNSLLAKRMKTAPPTANYKDGKGVELDLTFGPWKITKLSGTNRLNMTLPIAKGTFKSTSVFAGPTPVVLDGVEVEISLNLDFITAADGKTLDLTFDLTTPGAAPTDTGDGVVTVTVPDVNDTLKKAGAPGTAGRELAKHLPQCLISNKAALSYAISSLPLLPGAGEGWMKPKDQAYFFTSGTGGQSYLAVAMMVRDLDPKTRQRDIDSSLCNSGEEVCVAIAKDVALEHVFLPAIRKAFPGATGLPQYINGKMDTEAFRLQGDDIVGMGMIPCKEVTHAGTGYHPALSWFEMVIQGSQLQIKANGGFHITGLPHASATFKITQGLKATVLPGTNAFEIVKGTSQPPDTDMKIPWYYYVTGLAALPLGLIVTAVVVAIVDLTIYGVTNAVANTVTSSGQTVGIGDIGLMAIQWPGNSGFTMTSGGLNDGIILGGSLA